MSKTHRKEDYEKVAELFKIMAHAKRLEILNVIKDKEITVSELSKILGVRKSNTSQHLALLRHTGLVTAEHRGKNVLYKLFSAKVTHLLKLLED